MRIAEFEKRIYEIGFVLHCVITLLRVSNFEITKFANLQMNLRDSRQDSRIWHGRRIVPLPALAGIP